MNSQIAFFNYPEFGCGSCESLKMVKLLILIELICWFGIIKFSQIWLYMCLYEVFEFTLV